MTTPPRHHVDLKLHRDGGELTVDGKPLAVRDFTLRNHYHGGPELELDLAVIDVSTVGEGVKVLIDESTKDTLRALGWFDPEQTAKVHAFIHARREFIVALHNCPAGDPNGDYGRWTGNAEARRVLAEDLGIELDKETGGLPTRPEETR